MATSRDRSRRPRPQRSSRAQTRRDGRAAGPAVFVVFGVGAWAALAIAGRGSDGLAILGVCVAVALVLALAPVRGDLGAILSARGDERQRMVDLRANWFAAQAMTAAVIVGVLVQVARGGDPGPYVVVGLAGGLAYLAAVRWLRRRA
jgi:hypothetical protein